MSENKLHKRNLYSKEKFLEGNRQRWLIVFLLAGAVVFGFDACGKIQKVDSYLTFLTFLSGAFILGYSGTETMKLFRVNSETQNVNQNTNQNYNANINEKISIIITKIKFKIFP